MTDVAVVPRGRLFSSPRHYPFQAEGVARAYFSGDALMVYDTGLGKGVCSMMLAALLFEDDLIDHVLVVCESNKVSEWIGDFRVFTKLDVVRYRTDPECRRAIAAAPPEVLVATYETFREDMASRVPGKPKALQDGFLTEALADRRVLVVYDEMTKLKNRSSGTYRHHEHFVKALRKQGNLRVLGLTATPIERDPENVFNLARLVRPGIMTVAEFERDHIKGYDQFGKPYGFKNLGFGDHVDPGIVTLDRKLGPILLVKSKSDADVRDEFPTQVEQFSHVNMTPEQARFYRFLVTMATEREADEDPINGLALETVLRQIAAVPESLARSRGELATMITSEVGAEGLAKMGSGKVARMVEMLDHLVTEQGEQVVVFTFFGQSVLPLIERDLLAHGHSVAVHTGGMSQGDQAEARERFRSGKAMIYLSSDAGSRGVNLSEASWVINFEIPVLAATYTQRINRHNRINSDRASTFAHSLISARTIEEEMAQATMAKNQWFDTFTESSIAAGTKPHRVTAVERKALIAQSRESPA